MKNCHNNSLISTKLHIPPIKSRMLSREHLLDKLSTGKDSRLIVISGVAGSGKTSLACQWIKQDDLRVAWYSLDKTDNESDIFFRYFLTALSNMDDGLASAMRPWLQEQEGLSGKKIMPFVIQCLIDLSGDMYLVLDDYHLITSREIHDALSYFLDHIPPKMHIVIISRYSFPFSISHFKVRNQMMEISAEEMKFTEKETKRFFTDIIPVKLSTGEVHELARYTEGWVGGLQLFGLSLKGKDTLDGLGDILSRALKETTNYLLDEVINAQPKKVKAFLYKTALLSRFNTEVCREVTGLPDTPDILDHIYRNNLFLIPLNTELTWYRYHHLFEKAIRERVKMLSPAMFTEVHRKAALWFAKNNYLEDAFRHAFASEDFEFAADLLEDYLFLLYERHEVASSLRWLSKLPHEVFMQRALLRLYECSLRIRLYECSLRTGSLQLLDIEATLMDIESHQPQAFERYGAVKKTLCQDLLIYFKYILSYYRDPVNTDANRLNEVLQRIFLEHQHYFYFIEDMIVMRFFLQGDLLRAGDALREASTKIFASGSAWAKMTWFKSTAHVERWQGHLRRAETVLQEAFVFLDREGLSDTPLKFILYSPMAWAFYYRNDLEKALEYAAIALRHAEEARTVKDIIEGNILLASIYWDRGEVEKVHHYMQKIQHISEEIGDPNLIGNTDACLASLSMLQGDLGWTKRWADQRKISMDEPFSFHFAFECITQARLFYMQGQYQDAAHMLETLRDRCINRGIVEMVLCIDLLHSATLYALNERDRAKTIMAQALAFSETEGYIRQFVDCAQIISPILIDMAGMLSNGNGHRSSYLITIMKACGIGKNGAIIPSRHGNLTRREIEILELMAAGYKYREIADKIFVSLDTVKTHTSHIFEKMEVKTKLQAIRRAEKGNFFGNH